MEPRILVVDDEPDLELLMSQKFRRGIRQGEIGFLFARDGEEALSVLSEQPNVDLVLSDINMPRMDGLTLLSNLQALDRLLESIVANCDTDKIHRLYVIDDSCETENISLNQPTKNCISAYQQQCYNGKIHDLIRS